MPSPALTSAQTVVPNRARMVMSYLSFLRAKISDMYFGDEEAANSDDPVLNIIEQPERRKTLIAPRSERDGAVVYTFDIYLQGGRETVFFDV